MAMKILVTGITGRIGANLAAALVRDGHSVRGLVWPQDRRVEKLGGLDLELQYGSLTDVDDVRNAVEGVDAVYHLGAAFQGGGPFTTEDYFEINVRGTFNMLEVATANPNLHHFILASTDSVYKKSAPGGMTEPVREDVTPRSLAGWYGVSKGMAEDMCTSYFRGSSMPTTVLRFPNTLGAGEIIKYAAFYLSSYKDSKPELARLWQGEEKLVLLRDENGRPWKKHMGDVRDVVHGCVVALGKEPAFGQTFQLGAPKAFTWDEAVPHMSERLDIPFVDAPVSGTPTFYEYDLTKARTLLGFEPQYDIIRMIDDAVAFSRGEDIGVLPTE